MDLGIELLWISIDAATKETYERIRVGGNFDKVIRNIDTLFNLRDRNTQIWFHYIVNKYNIGEVLEFINLVDNLRQEQETSIQFTRILQGFKEIEDLYVEIPRSLRRQVEDKGKELGVGIVWNADVPEKKPPMKRCLEFFEPFIFVTGHVIPCCAGNEANRREFQKGTALGNIFEQSFEEIWNGEKYKHLRRDLRSGKTPLSCGKCPVYRR